MFFDQKQVRNMQNRDFHLLTSFWPFSATTGSTKGPDESFLLGFVASKILFQNPPESTRIHQNPELNPVESG